MKKTLKTIALVLVVIILSNSVTGCVLYGKGGYSQYEDFSKIAMVIDGILLLTIIWGIVSAASSFSSASSKSKVTTVETKSLTMKNFYTLPGTPLDSLTKKIQAVPEPEMTSFMETFDAIPQADKASAIDEINSLSETELYGMVGYLNSLSETQFAALLRNDNEAYTGN